MEEFRTCLSCGYARGFHYSARKTDDGIKIIFICPECGASFDIGLVEARLADLKPVRGENY